MDNGVIIRSYFNRWLAHPLSVDGYARPQTIPSIHRFIVGYEAGDLRRYDQFMNDFEPLK
jgi:hypothetical protein